MNKKNSVIIAIILILLLGTGSFVFAGSPEQKIENNNSNQTNNEKKNENQSNNNNKVDNQPITTTPEDNNATSDGTLEPNENYTSNTPNNVTNSVQIQRPNNGNSNQTGNNNTQTPTVPQLPTNPVVPEEPSIPEEPKEPTKPDESNNDYTYEDILEAIKQAEKTLDHEDIKKAQDLLNKWNDPKTKEELENRLNVLNKEQNLTNTLKELEEQIKNATSKEDIRNISTPEELEKLKDQINLLPDNFKKEELKDTLEEILDILLDKTAPVISGIENNAYTNQSVTLTIDDKNALIKLDNQEITLEELNKMTENKINQTYNITAIDSAFNETKLSFTIDTVSPTAEVEYDKDLTQMTNEAITANLKNISEEITMINNEGKQSYVFDENGEFTFIFEDKAGNIGLIEAKVTNIDKIAPEYKKLGIVNFSRIDTEKRLDTAYVDEIVKVYVTFTEELKNAPIIKLNDIELETNLDEENSSNNNIIYTADYQIEKTTEEGFMNISISNIQDLAGNQGENLENSNINVKEHNRMYVIVEPGLEVVAGGYFNDKVITIKDPDFHHMTIKRSLKKPETFYTNTYEIPGTGTYTITVYNENNEIIIPESKMTYDGFAPTIDALGYIDDNHSEKIIENNEEIKEYQSVKLEITDATSLQLVRRVDAEGNVLETYKECNPIKKYDTVTLNLTEAGEYIIEALDAAHNKTTIKFIIKD